MPEREPRYPYPCPRCGADLEQPGAVIGWRDLPEKAVGHIEPGDEPCGENGINFVIDNLEYNPPPTLQCSDCGELLDDFEIVDIYGDYEMEVEEPEGKEAETEETDSLQYR